MLGGRGGGDRVIGVRDITGATGVTGDGREGERVVGGVEG